MRTGCGVTVTVLTAAVTLNLAGAAATSAAASHSEGGRETALCARVRVRPGCAVARAGSTLRRRLACGAVGLGAPPLLAAYGNVERKGGIADTGRGAVSVQVA